MRVIGVVLQQVASIARTSLSFTCLLGSSRVPLLGCCDNVPSLSTTSQGAKEHGVGVTGSDTMQRFGSWSQTEHRTVSQFHDREWFLSLSRRWRKWRWEGLSRAAWHWSFHAAKSCLGRLSKHLETTTCSRRLDPLSMFPPRS